MWQPVYSQDEYEQNLTEAAHIFRRHGLDTTFTVGNALELFFAQTGLDPDYIGLLTPRHDTMHIITDAMSGTPRDEQAAMVAEKVFFLTSVLRTNTEAVPGFNHTRRRGLILSNLVDACEHRYDEAVNVLNHEIYNRVLALIDLQTPFLRSLSCVNKAHLARTIHEDILHEGDPLQTVFGPKKWARRMKLCFQDKGLFSLKSLFFRTLTSVDYNETYNSMKAAAQADQEIQSITAKLKTGGKMTPEEIETLHTACEACNDLILAVSGNRALFQLTIEELKALPVIFLSVTPIKKENGFTGFVPLPAETRLALLAEMAAIQKKPCPERPLALELAS